MKHLWVAGWVLALLASPGAAPAETKAPVIIRFGYGLAEQTNQGRAAREFAAQVARISEGRMRVHTVGASAMGSDVKMQQALIEGRQEMMVGSTSTLVSIAQEMALWDTPFLFSNVNEADQILDGPVGEKIRRKLDDKGLIGLVYWENGFRNLSNNKRPIMRMEDFEGLQLRVMQNPIFIDSFKMLGANPVPLGFSELFGAMAAKTVDGQENPLTTILTSEFYKVQKYLTLTHHAYSPWIVLASKVWWDKLSTYERGILEGAALASRDFERQDTRREAAQALRMLQKNGMRVNDLRAGEAYRMSNKLSKVYARVGREVGLDLWIETQNELLKIRNK